MNKTIIFATSTLSILDDRVSSDETNDEKTNPPQGLNREDNLPAEPSVNVSSG